MLDFFEEVQLRLPGTLTRDNGGQPVLSPGSVRAVAHLLELAHQTGIRLEVPGAEHRPDRPSLRLDRLDDILSVDEMSRIMHVQAGIPIGDAEVRANDYGWTLGIAEAVHDERVGAWFARGAPGRADKANDPVLQHVAGLELVLPSGAELAVRPAPRRAVGPDLIRAVVGARGRLGVIVGIHLVAEAKLAQARFTFSFPDQASTTRALAWIRGLGVRPRTAALRGTELQVVVDTEGPRHRAATAVLKRVVQEHGGTELSDQPSIEIGQSATPASTEAFNRLTKVTDPKGIVQP